VSDFTISSASTIMQCRFPFRADVVMPPEAADDPDREKGTSVHNCAAKYINTKAATELLDPAQHPTWWSMKSWILSHWAATWVAEPAYAWDPVADKARLLGVDIGREYAKHGKLPREKGGTCDVVSVEGDTVYVYEFGTGFDVEHKAEQLRLQCLVAARAHGKVKAIGQLLKFRDDGGYPSVPMEFDEFALSAIAGEFAEYLGEVDGSEPIPGEHCSRCNLAPVCPAAASIVQALIPAESLVKHGWGLTIASPDHARWLLDHARLVEKAAWAVKDAVKAYVPKDGLVLGDGSLLVEGTRNMPRFDNARLMTLARTLGATEEQIEACNYVAVESAGLKVKRPAAVAKPRKKRAA
jgi:hypothetical protein